MTGRFMGLLKFEKLPKALEQKANSLSKELFEVLRVNTVVSDLSDVPPDHPSAALHRRHLIARWCQTYVITNHVSV